HRRERAATRGRVEVAGHEEPRQALEVHLGDGVVVVLSLVEDHGAQRRLLGQRHQAGRGEDVLAQVGGPPLPVRRRGVPGDGQAVVERPVGGRDGGAGGENERGQGEPHGGRTAYQDRRPSPRRNDSAVSAKRGAASRNTGPWPPFGTTQRYDRGMAA